jgi:hypothetical protein
VAKNLKNEDDETLELPLNERRFFGCEIKDSEWLQMFMNKNAMHDGDSESAQSIVKNIKFDYWTYMDNIYFNKKPVEDQAIMYSRKDLTELGQIPIIHKKRVTISNSRNLPLPKT